MLRFHAALQAEHARLAAAVTGLGDAGERDRLASALLARLMFVYFLQQAGYLDEDRRYLQRHLAAARRRRPGAFHLFLAGLFSEGFAQPLAARSASAQRRYGCVPFLGAALVERGGLAGVPDAVFEHVLDVFGRCNWRLDEAAAGAVTPAALHAVFETRASQQQHGAYFTAADVTAYMCRVTLLPCLLDKLARLCPRAALPLPLRAASLPIYPEAAEPGRLPGESARQQAARLAHLARLRAAVARGQLAATRDLLTFNLDLAGLLHDWLARLDDLPTLRAFYFDCLCPLTVLDPAAGSGALLLGALDVLVPLYTLCLQRLQALAGPADPASRAEVEQAAAEGPYSLALRRALAGNLYGVELVPEAAEACRLGLALRLIAAAGRAVPVPALTGHIRAGNALLGAAHGGAGAAGFDWATVYPEVMQAGGFDVVVGNPPYLEVRQVPYQSNGYRSASTRAVHALVLERGLQLLGPHGRLSMIVPLALVSTQRMRVVQELVEQGRDTWYANFAWRPGKLFTGVNRALTIVTAAPAREPRTFSTGYRKWRSAQRRTLFPTLRYVEAPRQRPAFWVPKLAEPIERGLLSKLLRADGRLADFASAAPGTARVYYRTTGGLYWKVFTDFPPAFRLDGRPGHSSRETSLGLCAPEMVAPVIAALSSDLFWWWYSVTSNLRDLNPADLLGFPLPAAAVADRALARLGRAYLRDIVRHSRLRTRRQPQTGRAETQSFTIHRSRRLVERIDRALAPHYGLSEAEVDYIVHYDEEYRKPVILFLG
jgi:hypothetical protein